jgi:hypothetical protein
VYAPGGGGGGGGGGAGLRETVWSRELPFFLFFFFFFGGLGPAKTQQFRCMFDLF